MVILFDIFINNKKARETVANDPALNAAILEMYGFIKGRVQPLKDKIDNEEKEFEEKSCCTIITLTKINEGKFLSINGYSEKLREKMLSCFSQDDIKFILKKCADLLNAFDN